MGGLNHGLQINKEMKKYLLQLGYLCVGSHFETKSESNTNRICAMHSGITSYPTGCGVYFIIGTI